MFNKLKRWIDKKKTIIELNKLRRMGEVRIRKAISDRTAVLQPIRLKFYNRNFVYVLYGIPCFSEAKDLFLYNVSMRVECCRKTILRKKYKLLDLVDFFTMRKCNFKTKSVGGNPFSVALGKYLIIYLHLLVYCRWFNDESVKKVLGRMFKFLRKDMQIVYSFDSVIGMSLF